MSQINGSVGRDGTNAAADVSTVQSLLNQVPPDAGGPDTPLKVDGIVGAKTIGAIENLQRVAAGFKWPDGRIDPNGKTWIALLGALGAATEESGMEPEPGPASADLEGSTATAAFGGGGAGAGSGVRTAKKIGTQLPSFIDVNTPGEFRGSIFFPSRGSELDAQDLKELAKFKKYAKVWEDLRATGQVRQFPIAFLGFADPARVRPGPDGLESNVQLTEARAGNVKKEVDRVLKDAGGPDVDSMYGGGDHRVRCRSTSRQDAQVHVGAVQAG